MVKALARDIAEVSDLARDAPDPQDLASAVRRVQRMGAKDAAGRNWSEWVKSRPELMKQVQGGKGKGKGKGKMQGPSLDPRNHDAGTLSTFLASLGEEEQSVVKHTVVRARRRARALACLESSVSERTSNEQEYAKTVSRLVSLMKHTRSHKNFEEDYNCLPSHQPSWAMPKHPSSYDSSLDTRPIEDLLIGIDCEMVAIPGDDSALARISVVNGRCELLFDRLVAPDDTPTDLRTHLTGIEAKDLEGLFYSREDARSDLMKLMTPRTILVGHTLHKDLTSLRLDVPLVVDVGLLYTVEGCPTRRPGLALMMEAVLGEENFRGADGLHNSTNDASGAMKILLHRLEYPREDVARVIVPPSLISDPEAVLDESRTLYAHRVPDRPGTFTALVALFAAAGAGVGAETLESVDMQAAQKGWRSARILFTSSKEAERVFLALKGESGSREIESRNSSAKADRAGRPQKLVEMSIPGGETALIYVRTMSADIGGAALSKDFAAKQKGWILAPSIRDGSTNGNSPHVAVEKAREWKGWKRALDDALMVAGGALPWKRLRAALVTNCQEAGAASSEGDDVLGNRAMACIPSEYLNKEDALVRMPRGSA